MIFLKLTRTAKNFFTRFGWLIAELIFVFMGLYGAFYLERMHDEDMDLLRKRQILEALVQEFSTYSEELSSASETFDQELAIEFFASYISGDKPFPKSIPLAGVGSLNTGIWQAMLQSGGMEILEVKRIQDVQLFFKSYQDFLLLFNKFSSLYDSFILPNYDMNASFFYEREGGELRDKYRWYVDNLHQTGTHLRGLSEQVDKIRKILITDLEETIEIQVTDE